MPLAEAEVTICHAALRAARSSSEHSHNSVRQHNFINVDLTMEPAGQPAQSLSPDNPKFPQKVRDILHKAQTAWLKNTEVCDVLMRYSEYNLPVARDPPHLPPGGIKAPWLSSDC